MTEHPLVAWHDAATRTTDALRAMLGPGAEAGHLCPRCGSDAHGRPWARVGERRYAASASRAGGHLVVVARPAEQGAIGVDVERADAEPPASAIVLHPSDDADPLEAWVAKEAVLKRAGTGLRVAPASIRLDAWRVVPLDAPPGLIARVATGPRNGAASA